MASTSAFGWETPDDTDLVKDGAAAIRTLGNSIDTSMAELKGGTTGQVLSKTSNTDMDFTWVTQDDANAIQNAIVDAKGDLIAATANDTPARLAVGTNGQVLTADSTASTGLKWDAPNGPAFRAYRATSNQSFSANTWTKLQLNAESYDTASCFDSTTNYRFTPNKAGYYQFNALPTIQRTGSGLLYGSIYKNGVEQATSSNQALTSDTFTPNVIDIIYMNGTTDYVELYVYDQAATARTFIYGFGSISYFSGVWIRS